MVAFLSQDSSSSSILYPHHYRLQDYNLHCMVVIKVTNIVYFITSSLETGRCLQQKTITRIFGMHTLHSTNYGSLKTISKEYAQFFGCDQFLRFGFRLIDSSHYNLQDRLTTGVQFKEYTKK